MIDYEQVKELYEQGHSIKSIARECGISYYRMVIQCEEWGFYRQPYQKGKWDADIPLDYELCDEGMERLVSAIIESAINDFIRKRRRGDETLLEERFFHSDWFSDLCSVTPMDIDSDKVIEIVKERAKK